MPESGWSEWQPSGVSPGTLMVMVAQTRSDIGELKATVQQSARDLSTLSQNVLEMRVGHDAKLEQQSVQLNELRALPADVQALKEWVATENRRRFALWGTVLAALVAGLGDWIRALLQGGGQP